MADEKIYVVMCASGRTMRFRDGMGSDKDWSTGPYLHILRQIVTQLHGAGSNYDPPQKLFINGKMVVEKGMSDIAWRYDQDYTNSRVAAQKAADKRHTPDWLAEYET